MKKNLTPAYSCWIGMRSRCNNPRHQQFKHYGGRGIRVCERWDSYANFLEDMGEKPRGLSLERINVDGDYEPGNCRWATQREQMRNMRITRRITVEGTTYVAADLADKLGVKTDTIVKRAKTCATMAELMDPTKRVFREGLAQGGKANGARLQARTHCNRGHEFTPENTRTTPQGWRVCRQCRAGAR
jgi:hypothetical protein